MCGIVGGSSTKPFEHFSWLDSARDTLLHRGPDDAGTWWSNDKRVGLGHRRLSIVDLSSAGHQPMIREADGLAITYNGEIYNFREIRDTLSSYGYKFTSNTDTEVILIAYKQWGVECLSHLRGMFAFGLYDESDRSLFLARDRTGEKPLFYTHQGNSLFFSSELKALLTIPELPRKISPASLEFYLAFGYVPSPNCILDGYNKLPPAHALKYDTRNSKTTIWRYWNLPATSDTPQPEQDLLHKLDHLLEAAVKEQLAADVPVGILLSGGIDSSLITAMASRVSNQVYTFNISFPGHAKCNESQYAQIVSSHFKTKHFELEAEASSAEMLPQLAYQFDEPIADSSMIPTWLLSKLVRQHCSVALGGDGGDELFGGYQSYLRLLKIRSVQEYVPPTLLLGLSGIAKRFLRTGQKGRNLAISMGENLKAGLPMPSNFFDFTARRQLLPQVRTERDDCLFFLKTITPPGLNIIDQATRVDFYSYLPEDILVKVDRASMLSSLEIRAPFLDNRIIEFAFRDIHSRLKVNGQRLKVLLKALAKDILPKNLNIERKQGFSIPLSTWLKTGHFRDLFWSTLDSPNCLFDRKYLRNLLLSQDRGDSNSERLFSLALFELWRKEYRTYL
jgi:asparagine synthase (glutamine-hydrolysing)